MKIFISDLDGTLLDSKKNLPPDFKETLKLIEENGDLFFFASGRSYEDVVKLIDKNEIPFNAICDNGAEIYINNESKCPEFLDENDAKQIVNTYIEKDFGILMLSTPKKTYRIMPTNVDPDDMILLKDFYNDSVIYTKDDNVLDKALKITIGSTKGSYEYLLDCYKDLNFNSTTPLVSGFDWLDFVHDNVNKGNAINHLIDLLNLTKDDVYCFGDYLNDITMRNASNHTYAMKNAHPEIIELFDEVIDSNDNYGVTKKIKEIIKGN